MTNPFTHPTDALLPHRMSVPWHDTLGYYQKRWPDRATPPRPKPSITGRTAYKSYVASYTQQNSQEIPGYSGLSSGGRVPSIPLSGAPERAGFLG